MKKTEWGITLGIKRTPKAQFVVADKPIRGVLAYGYKIDRHGVLAFGNTAKACEDNWRMAYIRQTEGECHD